MKSLKKTSAIAAASLAICLAQGVFAENPKVDLSKLPVDGRKSAFSEAWTKQTGRGGALEKVRPELSKQEIAALAEKSTGHLLRKSFDSRGSGTAFFIGKGIAVTNEHVVEKAGTYTLRMRNADFKYKDYPVKVLASDKASDLAIIKVEDADATPPLPLANPFSSPKVMDDIFIFGFPKELEGTAVMGQISAFRMKAQVDQKTNVISSLKDNWDCIQYTAPIDHGSSGSPVLNNRGEVIGVNYAMSSTGQLANFATSVKNIRKLLDRSGLKI